MWLTSYNFVLAKQTNNQQQKGWWVSLICNIWYTVLQLTLYTYHICDKYENETYDILSFYVIYWMPFWNIQFHCVIYVWLVNVRAAGGKRKCDILSFLLYTSFIGMCLDLPDCQWYNLVTGKQTKNEAGRLCWFYLWTCSKLAFMWFKYMITTHPLYPIQPLE